jgi:hypothetical protein
MAQAGSIRRPVDPRETGQDRSQALVLPKVVVDVGRDQTGRDPHDQVELGVLRQIARVDEPRPSRPMLSGYCIARNARVRWDGLIGARVLLEARCRRRRPQVRDSLAVLSGLSRTRPIPLAVRSTSNGARAQATSAVTLALASPCGRGHELPPR